MGLEIYGAGGLIRVCRQTFCTTNKAANQLSREKRKSILCRQAQSVDLFPPLSAWLNGDTLLVVQKVCRHRFKTARAIPVNTIVVSVVGGLCTLYSFT